MPVRVHLSAVRPTMRLARAVLDPDGRVVAGAGTLLREGQVRVLRRMALQSLLVEDAEVASWEAVRPLADELVDLDGRFGMLAADDPLANLKAAIARRLAARAARVAVEEGEEG